MKCLPYTAFYPSPLHLVECNLDGDTVYRPVMSCPMHAMMEDFLLRLVDFRRQPTSRADCKIPL